MLPRLVLLDTKVLPAWPILAATQSSKASVCILPPKKVSSKEILRACRVKMMLPLQRLTGIKTRRMAGESEFSIDLARRAIQECLDRSKYGPGDVELLICCNISRYDGPNFHFSFEPSTSVQLKRDFGLDNALVFDISNACAGMFTGINIADSYNPRWLHQAGTGGQR